MYGFAGDFSDARRGVDPNVVVTIKEVLDTEDEAISEVQRLTTLSAGKGSRHFYQSAKYYPDGRKFRGEDSEENDVLSNGGLQM